MVLLLTLPFHQRKTTLENVHERTKTAAREQTLHKLLKLSLGSIMSSTSLCLPSAAKPQREILFNLLQRHTLCHLPNAIRGERNLGQEIGYEGIEKGEL